MRCGNFVTALVSAERARNSRGDTMRSAFVNAGPDSCILEQEAHP